MNDKLKNEMLELWSDEYERQRASGAKHAVARATATNELKRAYPETVEWLNAAMMYRARSGENTPGAKAGMSLTASMGHQARRLRGKWDGQNDDQDDEPPVAESPSTPPQSPNGGNGASRRQMPGLVTYSSGTGNVTKTIIAALDQMNLKPGDVVHFGDFHLWSFVIGCTRSAIPNLIQGLSGQTAMADAGYVFDVQNKSYRNFVATVTEAPNSERDKEIGEIKARIDELMKRLNSL